MAVNFASVAFDQIIAGISFTTKKIMNIVADMKVNKDQSQRLAVRVTKITTLLQGQDTAKWANPGVQVALEDFQQFLNQCEQFLETFRKNGWIARIRAHSNHAHKFAELNTDLDRHVQDLSFGLHINIAHRNLAEDKIDALNDLEEIKRLVSR
jgi:hypothetical protein